MSRLGRRLFQLFLCLSALLLVRGDEDQDLPGDFGNAIARKYQELPPKGKFVAGACVGFVGTRLVINSATGILKAAGAAFITAEVLHYTGAMDEIPRLSQEQSDFVNKVKGEALKQAENFRVQVRRTLNPENVQRFFDNERMGALGVASGALAGTLL